MIGSGTVAIPYQVTTAVEFNSIRNNLSAHYILMNDIDLVAYSNFVPIGTSSARFTGVLDGNGYKVKNLKVSRNAIYTGLFGYIDGATIKRLGVVDANVNSQGSNYSGIIVGQMLNNSTIDQCYSTGVLNGQYGQGGITGWHAGGTISNCWSNASITSLGRIGGIVGNIVSATCYIVNSYTYSPLSAPQLIGGLVGSLGGGVTSAIATNSYWNTDIYPTSDAGTGLTTSQFADSSNFPTWDTNIWGFASYPYLKIFGVPPIPSKKETINLSSHLNVIFSTLERSKRKVNISLSHVGNVYSEATRTLQLMKNVTSHIDEIVSEVATLQNANVKDYEVSSYIEGIGSNASRIVRTVRKVETDVQPIQIVTDIQIPFKIGKPVYATVFVVENPTSSQARNNYSNASTIENATEMSVI